MTPGEHEQLLAKYDVRLAQYGYDPRTLGWNKPKHRLRYSILLEYFLRDVAEPLSLLDFGCGFGDLYGFCRSRGLAIDYFGIDLNPRLIEIGREVFPDARLTAGDPLRDGLPRDYDVIIASGTHNFAVADHDGLVERTFELFAAHARRGFALNFLSNRASFNRPGNAYLAPERALALALRFSNRVVLRHDYMPFEFSLFVDLRTEFDAELTVYPEFLASCDIASRDDAG